MWSQLNRYTLPDDDATFSDARRRVLNRLGEYAQRIITPLNMRPTAVGLLSEDAERVEVRISTPGRHIVLVISPEGDLSNEVFLLRAAATRHLPLPQLISYDLSQTLVPFHYALEQYIGGCPATALSDGPQLRIVARQIGRTLRRLHGIPAPGFGQPTPNGRWPAHTWTDTLAAWLEQREWGLRVQEVLGADGFAALQAATLAHETLEWSEPRAIHGAVTPARALATVGDSAQLEALVRPGALVGGDPLFDLAHALLPQHPATFRQGVWEGYTASGQLDAALHQRVQRLRLLLATALWLERADPEELARLAEVVAATLRELT